MLKRVKEELHFLRTCRELGVPVWSCPQFIFLLMGIIINVSVIAAYYVGQRYASPETVIALVTGLTVILLVITHLLVNAFEHVVRSKTEEMRRSKENIELRDQFVHFAAHDLRASATAIKWGLRTLEMQIKPQDGTDRKIFAILRSRNEHLIQMVRNILLITQIEGGKYVTRRQTFSLEPILLECINLWADINSFSTSMIKIDVAVDIPRLSGDADTAKELFSLLIDNAMCYAENTDPHIVVTGTRKGAYAVIAVENNGFGIKKEDAPYVFQKYWKKAGTEEIEHTGLGLYLSKLLADLLGGTIAFESRPGKTVFTVTLPESGQ